MREDDSTTRSDSPVSSQPEDTPNGQEDHYAGAHTKEDFLAVWDELTAEDKLAVILSKWAKDQWWDIETLRILALFFNRKTLWGYIKDRAKEAGVNEFD